MNPILKQVLLLALLTPAIFADPGDRLRYDTAQARKGKRVTVADQIKADLAKGILNSDFIESYRIVPPDSVGGQDFQREMTALLKQTFPTHILTRQPVQFLLVDDETPNGFYVLGSHRPAFIGITRGSLKKVQNLDQLAALVAHEMNHYYLRRNVKRVGVTKLEETNSDIKSLWDLSDAGLDPKQVLAFHRDVLADEDHLPEFLKHAWQMLDVHVSDPLRERLLEQGLTELHRERGPLDRPPTPLTAGLKKAADTTHDSYVDRFLRENSYSKDGPRHERFAIVNRLIQATDHWNEGRTRDTRKLLASLIGEKEFIELLKGNQQDPRDRAAMDALAETLLRPENSADPYAVDRNRRFFSEVFQVKERWESSYKDHSFVGSIRYAVLPVGPLARVERLWNELRNTHDTAHAQALAKEIEAEFQKLESADQVEPLTHVKWAQPHWESAAPPTKVEELPWNHLVNMGNQPGSETLKKVLYRFGLHDPRLLDPRSHLSYYANGVQTVSRGPAYWDPKLYDYRWTTRDLKFDGASVTAQKEPDSYYTTKPAAQRMANQMEAMIADAARGNKAAAKELEDIITRRPFERFRYDFPVYRLIGMRNFGWNPELILRLNAQTLNSGLSDLEDQVTAELSKLLTRDFKKYRGIARRFFLEGGNQIKYWTQNPFGGARGFRAGQEFLGHKSIKFLLEDPFHLFTDEEKRGYLRQHVVAGRALEEEILTVNAKGYAGDRELGHVNVGSHTDLVRPIRKLFGYAQPKDWKQALAFLESSKKDPFLFGLAEIEAHSLLRSTKAEGLDVDALLQLLERPDPQRDNVHIWEPLQVLLEKKPELLEVLPVDRAVRAWSRAAELQILPRDAGYRSQRTASFIQRASALADNAQRALVLENLLTKARIEDPQQRQEAVKLWASAIRRIHGLDDGTAAYARHLRPVLERISDGATTATRYEMLRELSESLESQKALSLDIGERVARIDRKTLIGSWIPSLVAEMVVYELHGDTRLAQAFAKFLSQPGSTHSKEEMMNVIRWNSHYQYWAREHSYSGYRESHLVDQLDHFHREYWLQPLPVRTAIADMVLEPPPINRYGGKIKKAREDDFEKRFDFVLNEILPPNPTYGAKTRELLHTYLSTLEPYQRGRYLAAIMAATRRANEGDEQPSPGEFLGTVLDQMGPAEKKGEQAIHSYPSTPDDIRRGIEKSKTMSDVMPRWEVWRLISKLPPQQQRQIERVNGVEGAASFRQVMNIRLKAGSPMARQNGGSPKAALALTRPFSRERMKDGFKRGQAFVGKLEDAPLRNALSDILHEAEKLGEIELDPALTAPQFAKAHELFDGLEVILDDEVYRFGSAKLLGKPGTDHEFMSLAEGTHFNDLPADTEAQRELRRKWAMAHIFVELSFLLSGVEADEDPHGGNVRIARDELRLTRLDPKGIALHPPSPEALRALGDVLARIAAGGLDDEAFRQRLLAEFQAAHARYPEEKPFLVRSQKALLALQDFWRYLKPGDSARIFASLHANKKIHAEVLNGLFNAAASVISTEQAMEVGKALSCTAGLIRLQKGNRKRSPAP